MMTESKFDEAPEMLKEYILAQDLGWSLEYIRSLSENDRDKFFMLAITKMSYKNFDIINMMAITTTGKSLI
jgi:hypothetical protein